MQKTERKIAVLSMYRDEPGQNLRFIEQLLEKEKDKHPGVQFSCRVFPVRYKNEFPDPEEYHVFISTGGPGNPHDGAGAEWEARYFQLLDRLFQQDFSDGKPRFHFSICHSFQLLCKHFGIAEVSRRADPTRFGIFECAQEEPCRNDALFAALPDPVAVMENRNWQCVHADAKRMAELGIKVLVRENADPDSALLALRISPYWVAVQFHPEADPSGLLRIYSSPEKKQEMADKGQAEETELLLAALQNPGVAIQKTYDTLLPGFLKQAAEALG